MLSLFKKEKLDNKGSTLVEIIVSVLIIGIVFVPLLMGLTNAMKANTRAEKNLNAESAGVNCIETIKAVGKKGLESITSSASGSPVFGTEKDFTAFSTSAKIKRESLNTYRINNINEGSNTYYAKVSFSDASYTSGSGGPSGSGEGTLQNDVLYTQYAAITGDGARPEMVKITKDMDDSKLETLRTLAGTQSETVQIPVGYDMRSLVRTKQTVVVVGRYPADHEEYPNKYYIQTGINYKVTNINGEGKFYFNKDQGEDYLYSTPLSAPQICKSSTDGGPNTLLLFYYSLRQSDSQVKLMNQGYPAEEIVFIKLIPDEIKLYTFISYVDIADPDAYSGAKMKFSVLNTSETKNTDGDVQVFCSVTPEKHSLTSEETSLFWTLYEDLENPSDRFSVIDEITEEKKGSQMYDVTVDIYDTEDVLRASKKSTIIVPGTGS